MKFKKYYEKYMYLVGVGGSLVFYLQTIKIFYEKNAGAVSLAAFIIAWISVFSWLIYGIILHNRVLIFANILATLGASLVIIGVLIYG